MGLVDIIYEKKDSIAIATFNRPKVLNAFRQATLHEFIAILDDVQADDTVRVLVITGQGRAFSAGIDLKEMAYPSSDSLPLKQAYGTPSENHYCSGEWYRSGHWCRAIACKRYTHCSRGSYICIYRS